MFHFPFLKNREQKKVGSKPPEPAGGTPAGREYAAEILPDVNGNLSFLSNYFGNGIGLLESRYEFSESSLPFGLAYIDSITDKKIIREDVLTPLLKYQGKVKEHGPDDILIFLQNRLISVMDTKLTTDMDEIIRNLVSGYSVLFLEGAASAILIESRKVEKKAVEVPENETTVLGSQESFTDDLTTNTCLILKRLPAPNLRFEEFRVGSLTKTEVELIWLDGIADPKIIEEARKRIRKIEIDHIDGIGELAQLIEDQEWSVFPKFRQTERPDMTVRSMTDGRFAILCSNSPFAFVAPINLWDNFKTMDDYEDKHITSSYLRIVRYIAFFLATLVSGIYLAFVTYNQVIIPPNFALNIAAGREGVPLPSVLELLLLSLIMTIIREAGLRMTSSVAYFVGTLAAIIIGQAVVTAGYVSASLIIVVAVSTIASFAISTTTLLYPSRLLNYYFILNAALFGIFGIVNALVILYWHLVSLSSFGVPYLYPILPFDKDGFKDTLIRFPFSMLKKRAKRLAPQNRVKVGESGIQ